MINLRKLSQNRSNENSPTRSPAKYAKPSAGVSSRVSIRDRLLAQEIQELQGQVPPGCYLDFPNPASLHHFIVTVSPEEGFWKTGRFRFEVEVPLEYNNVPPRVLCRTKLWHPNVSEDGAICLSLLRPTSLDGTGWLPTRRLKDVIWGLNSLFTDLVDFDDPLNIEAADHYRRNVDDFKRKLEDYIQQYCHHQS